MHGQRLECLGNWQGFMERGQIGKILHDELERARLLYDAEAKAFHAATEEIIATDPGHPDRTAAIRLAGEKRRSALDVYSRALDRFVDFIIDGVVPDDLKGMTGHRSKMAERYATFTGKVIHNSEGGNGKLSEGGP